MSFASEASALPAVGLLRRMELAIRAASFPLNAHEPIEVHAFRFEPGFEGFT